MYSLLLGNCVGIDFLTKKTPTAQDCLMLCNSTLGCRWFTYYQSVSECILFRNCPTVDESCEDCVSGERRCIDETTSTTTVEPTPSSTTTPISTTTEDIPKGMLNQVIFTVYHRFGPS
jgi:hypothetical protein